MPNLVPVVIEKESRGERSYDIYSRLLKDRITMLDTDVNQMSASLIVAQMLFLESSNKEKPINFYINSPGGSVTAGMSIYDTMQLIKCPVHTIVIGMAASMGSFLASAGTGTRMVLPNSRHMIHQPLGGARGQASDIRIQADEILFLKERLNKELSLRTGQAIERIREDTDRDFFMSPDEAVNYGLIDTVLNKRPVNPI